MRSRNRTFIFQGLELRHVSFTKFVKLYIMCPEFTCKATKSLIEITENEPKSLLFFHNSSAVIEKNYIKRSKVSDVGLKLNGQTYT